MTGLGRLLPAPTLLDWHLDGDVASYGRNDLARLVNGGADRYLDHGLREAVTGEYSSPNVEDARVRVEIFDMGSRLGAFGYLASTVAELRDPASAESPGVPEIGGSGTIGPGSLTFFRGSLFVRLAYLDLSPEATEETLEAGTREHLPRLARELARELPGSSELPDELDLLPSEGRVRRSELHHPRRLLGVAGLGPGVSAMYGDPGPRYRLGVPLAATDAERAAFFEGATRALASAGPVDGIEGEARQGELAGQPAVVVKRGSSVAVALAAPSSNGAPSPAALARAAAAAVAPPEESSEDAPSGP